PAPRTHARLSGGPPRRAPETLAPRPLPRPLSAGLSPRPQAGAGRRQSPAVVANRIPVAPPHPANRGGARRARRRPVRSVVMGAFAAGMGYFARRLYCVLFLEPGRAGNGAGRGRSRPYRARKIPRARPLSRTRPLRWRAAPRRPVRAVPPGRAPALTAAAARGARDDRRQLALESAARALVEPRPALGFSMRLSRRPGARAR